MSTKLMFSPAQEAAAPMAGIVILIPGEDRATRYMRITHVFEEELYGMPVTTAEQARYAGRPHLITWETYSDWMDRPGCCLGQMSLPAELTRPLDAEDELKLNAEYELIEPLVELMKERRNLHRNNFTALIRNRAEVLGCNFKALLRPFIRYYYFGGDMRGLLTLIPGPDPGCNVNDDPPAIPRGRKSKALEAKYGPKTFTPDEEDIDDMIEAYKEGLREGPSYLNEIFEKYYLKSRFPKRHPDLYQRFLREEIPPPVTERMFRHYIDTRDIRLPRELEENRKGARRNQGYSAVLRAFGPGSVYEIDATGGRVVLVSEGPEPVEVGSPWIYLVIDRWSRYVAAVYITLRSPSFSEVRHALLAMLTTRERYRLIGCNVKDEKWPHGSAPVELYCDRGSEFLSDAFEEDVTEKLRTHLAVLPPLTPDGKAIIERVIRTIKRRISSRLRKAGGYTERPTSGPKASSAYKKARKAAVHSLAELYRVMIDVILDYNSRPHTTLRRMPILADHGIKPTPLDAFIFGRQHITGEVAAISDEDYVHALLDKDTAQGIDGCVRYKGQLYEPTDPLASRIAYSWRKKAVGLNVEVDELGRQVRVWAKSGWATFTLKPGLLAHAGEYTPEEQVRLREVAAEMATVCKNQNLVRRLGGERHAAPRRARAASPRRPQRQERNELRSSESDAIERRFRGIEGGASNNAESREKADERQSREDKDFEAAEIEAKLAKIREHRSRK